MKKPTVAAIREMVKNLRETSIKTTVLFGPPLTAHIYHGAVHFCNGVVLHPYTFLDMVGVEEFRKLPRDVPTEAVEECIRDWRLTNQKK